eukprot:g28854.t1
MKPLKQLVMRGLDTQSLVSLILPDLLLFASSYQINARTELAVRYNDISPLENHHCAFTFQISSQPESNIFSNMDPEIFKQARQVSNMGQERKGFLL